MISLKNITKKYGEKNVFDNFSLDVEEGAVTAVLGASGSGKTTLLNILAGITEYEGEVTGEYLPVSFVFQKDRLVPNLTVKENLLLVNPSAGDAADSLLSAAGLADAADAYPNSLSGGMARRVAILRAFIYPSRTILLDEPFINLDPALKNSLIWYFKEMREKDERTAILVTHDVKEAATLASRAVIIGNGKVFFDKKGLTAADENALYAEMIKAGEACAYEKR